MNFGSEWKDWLGDMPEKDVFAVLDHYYAQGGNFIDTANGYQNGESEKVIGKWLKQKGCREEMVIATKFTAGLGDSKSIKINSQGNNLKSMRASVDRSLKSLGVDYIDILYVHWWTYDTSIEELMQGLHQLVVSGKVLYLAASDFPAWVLSACCTYAKENSLSPFVLYQGRWNLGMRDFELDIIPCCRYFGMGLAPWGVIGQGAWKTKAQREAGDPSRRAFMTSGELEASQQDEKISEALEKVAKELGPNVSIQTVALLYVMHKYPYHTFPIIGGRKLEHLKDNISALDHRLSDAQIQELEKVSPLHPVFPHAMIGVDPVISNPSRRGGVVRVAPRPVWEKQ